MLIGPFSPNILSGHFRTGNWIPDNYTTFRSSESLAGMWQNTVHDLQFHDCEECGKVNEKDGADRII